jgi:hypothetical protein
MLSQRGSANGGAVVHLEKTKKNKKNQNQSFVSLQHSPFNGPATRSRAPS